jgi:vitamin B12 transporter
MEYGIQSKHSLTLFILLAGLAGASLPVLAEEVDDGPVPELPPGYVVVSTRTPISLERASPSVEFIDSQEIEFWGDMDLVDVLSRQKGLAFWSNGTPGSLTSLSVRGAESNQNTIVLDGRRLNPGFGNQFDLEFLGVNNLSSVEIQRGASSVNYGSSGIGSVIALNSSSALDGEGFSGSATMEGGSNEFVKGSVSMQLSQDTWGLSLGASSHYTDNERDNDDFSSKGFSGRFDLLLGKNLTFEIVGQYSDSEKGTPNRVDNFKRDDRQWNENWLLSPGLRFSTDELSVHTFYSRSESRLEAFNDFGFLGTSESDNRVESDEFSLQIDYSIDDTALITAGAVFRDDEASNAGGLSDNYEQAGIWSQLIMPIGEKFEFRGGLRFDNFSGYDNTFDGNLELVFYLSEYTSLFSKIATSYAPPAPVDLFFDEDDTLVDDGLGGVDIVSTSTSINPEESESYEIGIRQYLLDGKLEWSAVLFRSDITDLITYVSLYDPNGPSVSDDEYGSDTFNIDEATTEGVEFETSYAFNQKVNLGLGYTYLTAKNETTDERLAQRPRHLVTGSVVYQASDSLSFGADVLGQFDRERGVFSSSNEDIEDYFVVNAVTNWRVNDELSLFVRVDNLLDEDYAPILGYPALGRAGYIGARYSF